MRNPLRLLLAISTITMLLISCQKEVDFQFDNNSNNNPGGGSGSSNKIEGDWNFLGLKVSQSASVSVTDAGMNMKAETLTNYMTENNVGTVKITTDKIYMQNVGYSINSVVNLKMYIDGVLVQSQDSPISFVQPPANDTSGFVRNSNDSLTMNQSPPVYQNGTTVNPGPMGIKISWSGDTLLLKASLPITGMQGGGGSPLPGGVLTGYATSTMRLKKK